MNYIGDTLFVSPLIKALFNFYDSPLIDVINGEKGIDILKNNPYINKIIKKPNLKEEETILIEKLKKQNYDLGYAATPAFWAAILLKKVGIKKRVGLSSEGRGFLLTHKTRFLKHKMHIVDSILSPLKRLGINNYSNKLELFLTPEENEFGKKTIKNYKNPLIVHLGATRFSKRYPVDLFSKVLDMFHQEIKSDIILIGSNDEIELSDTLKKTIKNTKIISDMTGKLTIREMISLMKYAHSFIGGDSAPLHIASSFNINTLGIYGDTLPLIYGALGENSINISGRKYCNKF